MHHGGLRFDLLPPANGYAWWYVDGLSDDGEFGVTVIAFIGSVFSPYYAWARRRAEADPFNHCALNVALYSKRSKLWSMTERGASQVHSAPASLSIGNSAMRWTGHALEILIDERCAPVPRRLQGVIRISPQALCEQSFDLDAAGRHQWTPFAPCANLEVQMRKPHIEWRGIGYLDHNHGVCPLESDFEQWTWSRSSDGESATVFYDVEPRNTPPRSLALRIGRNGSVEAIAAPPLVPLPGTGWGIARRARADSAPEASVIRTLEDAPFYARSLLETRVHGSRGRVIHESLNLRRFSSRWVQCLLPFRMPRAIKMT
jgi:carotenoid 1,2-hydratase